MSASYPGSAKVFTVKVDGAGNKIFASHVNDLQDEVTAIEQGLLNGTAPLNSSNSTVANLSVTNNSTIASANITTLNVGSTALIAAMTANAASITALTSTGLSALTAMTFNGVTTPATLSSGDVSDYNPTGLSTTFALRVVPAAGGSTLTSLAAINGGFKLLVNASPSINLVVKHESGGTATNRFWTQTGADVTLLSNVGTMLLWYDPTTLRWRQVG